MNKRLWIILLFVIILFFHYPVMIFLQHNDNSIDNQKFSLTTSRGETDNNWFVNDIRSVRDSPGLFLKDPTLYEHKDEIIPLQGTFPFVMHAVLYLFFDDGTLTLLIGSIISTILTLLLLFKLSDLIQKHYKVKQSEIWTLLLICGILLVNYGLLSFIKYLLGYNKFLLHYIGYVGRFININHIIIFYILWFTVLQYVLLKNQDKKYLIYLGLTLVLLQYSYVYFFVSALLFTGLAIFFRLGITKKSIIKQLYVFGTWFILSLPYIINKFKYSAFNDEYILRAGKTIVTQYPWWIHMLLVIILCIGFMIINYFYLKKFTSKSKKKKQKEILPKGLSQFIKESYLELSFIITTLFVLNLEKIIGFTVQPHHWVAAFIEPMMFFVGFISIIKFLKIIQKNKVLIKGIKWLSLISIVVLLCLSVVSLAISAFQWYGFYYLDSQDVEMINFVNDNTNENDVFFADTHYTNDIILTNTQRRVLLGQSLHTALKSKQEIHSRLLYGYEQLGLSVETLYEDIKISMDHSKFAASILNNQLEDHYSNWNFLYFYYHNYYNPETGVSEEQLLTDIKQFVDGLIDGKTNKTYKLDYLVYTRKPFMTTKEIVFENDRYLIVKNE